MAKVKLNKKKRASLQQASVFLFAGIAAVLLLALFTYSPDDPGAFHSNQISSGGIKNMAGAKGAWLADFLLGTFGYVAYLLPPVLVVVGVTAFHRPIKKNPNNPRGGVNAMLTMAGAFFAFFSASALSHLLFSAEFGEYGAGGMLGSHVAELGMNSALGFHGSVLFFLSMFLVGMTLLVDISWGKMMESIGGAVLKGVEWLKKEDTQINQSMEKNRSVSQDGMQLLKGYWNKIRRNNWSKQDASSSKPENKTLTSEVVDDVASFELDTANKVEQKQPNDPTLAKIKTNSEQHNTNLQTPDPYFLKSAKQAAEKSESKFKLKKQPAKRRKIFALPSLDLLNPLADDLGDFSTDHLNTLKTKIIHSLDDYGVKIKEKTLNYYPGPVITRFEFELAPGVKCNKVTNLSKDLARNLGVSSIRVIEVIPGKKSIGLEIPNKKRDLVSLRSILSSSEYRHSKLPLTLALGSDIAGSPINIDLTKMPHLLIAGITDSGKSVAINAMLLSILYKATPEQVRLILIDPKMLQLNKYEDIPHLLTPIITDTKDAISSLHWCISEMERRYYLMAKLKVRNIVTYNKSVQQAIDEGKPLLDLTQLDSIKVNSDIHTKPNVKTELLKPLPYIVVVIDEFAEMIMVMGKKVEKLIVKLTQKARASGIHLILATQRPTVDVITGLIKANITARMAFQVSTKIDSRTILGRPGAEELLGHGDMLYLMPTFVEPQRIHSAYISDDEIDKVTTFLKTQSEPEYVVAVLEEAASRKLQIESFKKPKVDPLYNEGVVIVSKSRRASISYLQRRLKVGYNRAAGIMEEMENAGIVSSVKSNGTREVLVPESVKIEE